MLIPSQTSQLLFLYDQRSLEKNATQFSHKEVDKNLLNQTLQKLVGSGIGIFSTLIGSVTL